MPTVNYDGWYFLCKIRNHIENIIYINFTKGGRVL